MSCNKPESSTSGQIIVQADPCKDSTFARMDAYVNNFFDTISNFKNDVDGLHNEINNFFIQYKLDSIQLDVTVDSSEPDA